MRNIIILITIICIAFLANADLFAQDAENVEQVSRIYNHWSSSGCIVIQGDYAYIATGLSGLQIVDISDPDNFEIVGYYDDNPNSISDVYVSSDYAYLTDHGDYNVEVRTPGGLLIVDISDPENPVEAGACEAGEWYSSIDVFVVGDYAYIGEVSRWSIGPGNLRIVDISDPENPEEISNFDTQGSLWDICVSGDYAYAAMSGEHQCSYGLLVFDVSDPTNPLRAGYYLPDWNGAESISIVDDYAYMSFHDGLHIIDISDPTNPEDLSTCEIEWPARDLSIFENHAYEIGYDWDDVYGFLRAIDVSDPTNPEQVSFYQFEGYRPERLCITNETAYVIGGNFTHYHNYHEITRRLIKLINISDPTEPEEVSVYQSGGNINDIFIAGEYAYAAAGADGLRVIDVSDSTDPVEVAVYEEAGNASSVFVSNNYAFIGDNSNIPNGGIFRVIDMSDPSNPEQTGSYQMDTFIRNIFLSGNYIYLTCYGLDRLGNSIRGSLRVIDVSDPGDPEEIGIYYDDCSCRDVFISGDYAVISMSYIEDHTARRCIRVLDISDPTNLEEVALLNLNGGTGAVFISDDYAYVSVSNSYPDGTCNYFLSVIDISDPANPHEVSRIELPNKGNDIFVTGSYAYVADNWEGGVRVINVSDPENLEEVGFYDTPGSANRIMVSGGM
ncbi:MAG: hypothetical protein HQ568_07480, partial [Calditrichaeota bacterium]|nr:hypothetical protein [Calditrichota bacterium]